jgi:hypothetical protein
MPVLPFPYSLKRLWEGGLQERLQALHLQQRVRCDTESIKSIQLKNVGVVFLYLLLGVVISLVTLLGERVSRRGLHAGRRRGAVRAQRNAPPLYLPYAA